MRIWVAHRRDRELNHELIWAPIVTLALALAFLLPFLPSFPYPCAFLTLTGHPCFSCGMTRSWIAASSAHFFLAWRWNPVGLLLFLAASLYVLYAWTVLLFRLPRLHVALSHRREHLALVILLAFLLLANWLYLCTSPWPPSP